MGYPGEVEDFIYDSVTLCVKNPDAWVLGLLVLAGAVYGRLWGLSESEWNPRTRVVGKYFELYTEVALQAGKLLGEAKNSSLGKSLRRVLTAMAVGIRLMFLCPVLCVGIVWCLVADRLLEALAFVIFFGLNLISFAVGLFAKAVIWLGNSFVALRGILRGSVTRALSFLSGLTRGFHH